MVRNQDDASFVSWASTFHPESVRLQNQDQNPWMQVYHETCSPDIAQENIPVAVQVHDVVRIEEDLEANSQQPCERPTSPQHHQANSSHPEGPCDDTPQCSQTSRPQPWRHSNLIDLIIGFVFAIAAFLWTVKIELSAIIIYTIAAGFHYLAEEVFTTTPAFLLFKSICLVLVSILMIVDAILLTVSVLVTEILGGVALFVCALFGGPRSGGEWHQFIRKTCHLIRWGFRNCHKGWKPERIFPISMEEEGVFLPVLHTTEDENHDDDEIEACCSEYPPPPPGYYSDTVVAPTTITSSSPRTSSFDDEPWSEEATLPSTVAFPNNYDHHDGSIVTSELISIAPENVQVVAEQEDEEDEEDDFVKNTQHVMIT